MTRLQDIGEFGLIERLARVTPAASNVIQGIGDDCAVVKAGDHILLLSCDLSVEDVHFRRRYASSRDIGWKAAATAVSDIAAMGGRPLFMLAALACPASTDVEFLDGLYQGLRDVADRYSLAIAGGDTTRSLDRVVLDITVIGEPATERWLLRSGARNGDIVAATGPLGLSAAGQHALEHGHTTAESIVRAHVRPSPRIEFGQWLCAQPGVHAMLDLSDGLLQDAGHIAERSGIGIAFTRGDQHIAHDLLEYARAYDVDPLGFVMTGGEDYELLFTVSASDFPSIRGQFHAHFGQPLFEVGVCTDAFSGIRVDGESPAQGGFDHFRR